MIFLCGGLLCASSESRWGGFISHYVRRKIVLSLSKFKLIVLQLVKKHNAIAYWWTCVSNFPEFIFFSYFVNLERFHAFVESVYTIIGWTMGTSVILMSNTSFWMEAINVASFEIESWNPSSNGIHRDGPEAMTECWHVAQWVLS